MKNRIRLNESQLHRVIKESVKKVLKEGGHLYWKDENGVAHTNSKETWRGVPGTTYICHGEWSDPEVWYNGHEYNSDDIEDYMWERFKDEMEDEDSKQEFVNATGQSGKIDNDNYEAWLKWLGVSWIKATLDEFDANMHCDDDSLNEGFISNVTQGAKSFFGNGDAGKEKSGDFRHNGGLNLRKRINAAKTNYQMTKEGGKINDVIQFLENLVANKQLSPQMTIAELIGGSLNNNKYGRLSAMRDNRTSRASRAMNDIYR